MTSNHTSIVFGATGYTGQHVVRLLEQRGEHVVAHMRLNSPHALNMFSQHVRVMQCDWSDDAIALLLNDVKPDVIYLTIGTTKQRMRREHNASYDAVDVALTRMVANAASTHANKPRLILLSALGASEKSMNAYSKSRAAMEEAVIQSTCPYRIVRASIITGPDRETSRPLEYGASLLLSGITRIARMMGCTAWANTYQPRTGEEWSKVLVDNNWSIARPLTPLIAKD